jgi:hypothetical protein
MRYSERYETAESGGNRITKNCFNPLHHAGIIAVPAYYVNHKNSSGNYPAA